jgi:type I restriction enzyme S subunit
MASEWRVERVADLQRRGLLRVEDGNHGEYRPRSSEFVSDGVAFIRAADIDHGRVIFETASKINVEATARITKGNQPAIPLGWSLSPLSAVSDVIYGAAFSSDRFNTKGIGHPLIRIRDLKTMDPGVFTDEMHSKGHLISAGDVVVGMDGEFRAYHWLGARSWLNQRVCFFKPSGGAGRVFIREALRPLLEAVERGQVGTTVIHIGKADIGRFQIPLATASVLKAFNEIAESLLDRIICTSETMRSLGELRDTLLPRLISGKLRIPEAEKLVEAVL